MVNLLARTPHAEFGEQQQYIKFFSEAENKLGRGQNGTAPVN
jgi:hypothetical protein